MKLNIKAWFVRPSDVVRDIENGFIGTYELARELVHVAVIESKARRIAEAMHIAEQLRAEGRDADIEEIGVRLAELMAARTSRKAA